MYTIPKDERYITLTHVLTHLKDGEIDEYQICRWIGMRLRPEKLAQLKAMFTEVLNLKKLEKEIRGYVDRKAQRRIVKEAERNEIINICSKYFG